MIFGHFNHYTCTITISLQTKFHKVPIPYMFDFKHLGFGYQLAGFVIWKLIDAHASALAHVNLLGTKWYAADWSNANSSFTS